MKGALEQFEIVAAISAGEHGRAGDGVGNIIVPANRMRNGVPAAAAHGALERDELRDQAVVARQQDAPGVEARKQVCFRIGLRSKEASA